MSRHKKASLKAKLIEMGETGKYPELDKIISRLIGHLDSARTTFIEYCAAAREVGLDAKSAWEYLRKRLKGTIPERTLYNWREQYLPGGTDERHTGRPKSNRHSEPIAIGQLGGANLERSTVEAVLEEEDSQEIYQMPVEQYNIKDVERYNRLFLIELVKYLHGLLQKTLHDEQQQQQQEPTTQRKKRGRPRKAPAGGISK